ncbi:MAG TPA: hypothetical protein VJT15_07480 [Pyrinomonadaceae bacterium]|nr:hypothetical protein [Pyrinomonadaceae bacterium]
MTGIYAIKKLVNKWRLRSKRHDIKTSGFQVLTLILIVVVSMAFQGKRHGRERVMDKNNYIVDKIDSFQTSAPAATAVLRTDSNGDYQIAKNNILFDVWSNMINDYKTEGKPLYIEFDPATKMVKEIFQPVMRRIEHVAQDVKDDRLKVILFMAPSTYHLKVSRANYDEMKQRLEESIKKATPILVTAHPDTQEILDVRSDNISGRN